MGRGEEGRGGEGWGSGFESGGGLDMGHECRVGPKESPHWREEAQICVKQLLSGRECRSDSMNGGGGITDLHP